MITAVVKVELLVTDSNEMAELYYFHKWVDLPIGINVNDRISVPTGPPATVKECTFHIGGKPPPMLDVALRDVIHRVKTGTTKEDFADYVDQLKAKWKQDGWTEKEDN